MFPTKTYRVVGLRPNGDRIIVWEWLAKEDAVRLHQALIAKSAAGLFIIEMDEGESTIMPVDERLRSRMISPRRRA